MSIACAWPIYRSLKVIDRSSEEHLLEARSTSELRYQKEYVYKGMIGERRERHLRNTWSGCRFECESKAVVGGQCDQIAQSGRQGLPLPRYSRIPTAISSQTRRTRGASVALVDMPQCREVGLTRPVTAVLTGGAARSSSHVWSRTVGPHSARLAIKQGSRTAQTMSDANASKTVDPPRSPSFDGTTQSLLQNVVPFGSFWRKIVLHAQGESRVSWQASRH